MKDYQDLIRTDLSKEKEFYWANSEKASKCKEKNNCHGLSKGRWRYKYLKKYDRLRFNKILRQFDKK